MAASFTTSHSHNAYNANGDQYIVHQQGSGLYWREALSRVPDARFDPLKGCIAGTRKEIIDLVVDWASSTTTAFVLWMQAQAGMGKTTIAHSAADALNLHGCLTGSFFFSRAVQARNTPDRLFTTIAYQMSSDPAVREGIRLALEADEDLGKPGCSLLEQYRELIQNPVDRRRQADGPMKPMVIVLDALDECGAERDRALLLKIISQFGISTNVKFFITSRPEPDISTVLSSSGHVQHLELSTIRSNSVYPDRDIATFVHYKMALTARMYGFTMSGGDQWPGRERREHLVQKASGLFIWASTACEFIHEHDSNSPDARLELILGHESSELSGSERQWFALDMLYLQVLRAAAGGNDSDKIAAQIREVLGAIVVALNPLSSSSLSSILAVGPPKVIWQRLLKLQSVLTVPRDNDGDLVRIIHLSFPDFLTNPDRCIDARFYIEPSIYHELLARKCLKLMSRKLRRDICKLGHAPRLNSAIGQQHINDCIPADLRYACTSWAEHLHKFNGSNSMLRTLVEEFMFEHLLHWLEVLSLLGVFDNAVTLLGKVNEWIKRNDGAEPTELRSLLEDSLKFVREFHAPIAASASQIYISALPFTPRSSMLYRKLAARYNHTAKIVCGARENWPPCLIIPCDERIDLLALFADGSRVVCSSEETLRVYDINVGTTVGLPMSGHTKPITSVAFTPNGRHILSGATDGSIRLWDTYTSTQIDIFQLENNLAILQLVCMGSRAGVRILSFLLPTPLDDHGYYHYPDSSNVPILISSMDLPSDNDHFIHASMSQKWLGIEVQCRQDPRRLRHQRCYVTPCLTLSPCGSYVAGVSANTLHVWDAETVVAIGRSARIVEHVRAIAFSPGGKWILSIGESEFKAWDWRTGSIVHQFSSSYPASKNTVVALSPRGDVMFFSSGSNICAWNICEDNLAAKPREESGYISAIAVSHDGSRIISAPMCPNTLRVWDLQGPGIAEWQGHPSTGPSVLSPHPDRMIQLNPHEELCAIIMSPDGTQFAIPTRAPASTLYIGHWSHPEDIIGVSGQDFDCIVFSLDGSCIAYRSGRQSVSAWNLATDTKITRLVKASDTPQMMFSPDGKRLVHYQWTWDLEHDIYTEFDHPFSSIAWSLSPSSSALAIGTYRDIYIRNAETSTITSGLRKGHAHWVNSISWSPNGDHIVSVSQDTICVWDLERRSHIRIAPAGHTDTVYSVSYSADGRWIVARSLSEWSVWDAHALTPIDPTGLDPLSRRCDQNVSFLRLKPDGWVVDLGNHPILWVPIENRAKWAVHGSSRLILGGKHEAMLVDISEIAC